MLEEEEVRMVRCERAASWEAQSASGLAGQADREEALSCAQESGPQGEGGAPAS